MSTARLAKQPFSTPYLIAGIIAAIFILLPMHAFLTVWLSSLVGHYTALRLWKEALLMILAVFAGYVLVKDSKLRQRFLKNRLHQCILAYMVLVLLVGVVSRALNGVTPDALGYGIIVDLRFLLFYVVVWVFAVKNPKLLAGWSQWLWWPLGVVIVVGLLQYFVLPYDFLRHFGYSERTIYPYATINHDLSQLRVFSTLRGANPLGAYLVLVLSILGVFWYRQRKVWQLVLLAGGLAVLFLSFSRSAWIGLFLSGLVLGWSLLQSKRAKHRAIVSVGVVLLVAAAVGFAFRHDTTFQNYLFHTNEKSTITTSSNDGHLAALQEGLEDVVDEPLGDGPGSAGPASVYNNHQVRIAENYFIQVAQETGWLGLVLFGLLLFYLARELWQRRQDTLALGLFAALIGLLFINLLSHAWTDDTLAYLFWGLAAVVLASKPVKQVK